MNEKMWYKNNRETSPEKANFILKKGHNAAIIKTYAQKFTGSL